MCPQDLDVVYAACSRLETLLLTCCGYLAPHALDPLLRAPPAAAGCDGEGEGGEGSHALPALTTLDVSYCPLPARSIEDLLTRGSRLEVRRLAASLAASSMRGDQPTSAAFVSYYTVLCTAGRTV